MQELEALTELAEAIARTEALEELLPAVAGGARRLLDAEACHVYLIERGGDDLTLCYSHPPGATARPMIPLAELGPELSTRARRGRVAVPLVADDELLGLVVADSTRRVELARAIAGQVAVGIKKVRLIERLTEQNLIADFFEQLVAGRAAPSWRGGQRGSAATSPCRTSPSRRRSTSASMRRSCPRCPGRSSSATGTQ